MGGGWLLPSTIIAFDAAGGLDDQFDVFLARPPRERVHGGRILRGLAQSLARRLNGQVGRGIGRKIFNAEMAGGIGPRGKAVSRRFADEIVWPIPSLSLRSFAEGGGCEYLSIGDGLVRFVHERSRQRRRRSQHQMLIRFLAGNTGLA